MKIKYLLIPAFTFLSFVSIPSFAWTGHLGIVDNYFEPSTDGSARVVLVLDQDVHSCGWNNAVHIEEHLLTPGMFKELLAVSLTAIATNRKISVQIDAGCFSDRATIRGIRLG